MRSRITTAIAAAALATPAFADIITFDDIAAGPIGNQYRSRGVMFFVGNGEYGTSTGLQLSGGQPLTAWAGPVFTAVSWPNIMNPGGGNFDIIVHFLDAAGNRTWASNVGITNDTDGNPFTIFIEGFDINGASLGRTQINGAGAIGTFSNPSMYSASIYAASGQAGIIGVDNFTFTLIPAPGSAAVLGLGCCGLCRRTRRSR